MFMGVPAQMFLELNRRAFDSGIGISARVVADCAGPLQDRPFCAALNMLETSRILKQQMSSIPDLKFLYEAILKRIERW
jgi:hypothetical protein